MTFRTVLMLVKFQSERWNLTSQLEVYSNQKCVTGTSMQYVTDIAPIRAVDCPATGVPFLGAYKRNMPKLRRGLLTKRVTAPKAEKGVFILGREKSISRRLWEDARDFFKKYENNKTRQIYSFAYRKYIDYCRSIHNAKSKEECAAHIDDYIQHLKRKGVTASTLHTYLASICAYHGVSMKAYDKPKRYTSEYRRGRIDNGKKKRNDSDLDNPKYKRLVEFQKHVGLRRNEIRKLKGSDFVFDESGNPCILVRKGKGGKRQLQRLLPCDVEFIKSYFDGSENPVFTTEEMTNKLPLHYLRAKFAQRCYTYFLVLAENPETMAKLEEEVRARWNKYNINQKMGKPKHLPNRLIEGYYFLRGKPRQFAIENGMPIRYNRLAILSTSLFALSHFRNDVTIASYLLVV